jgi:hypothetical protein
VCVSLRSRLAPRGSNALHKNQAYAIRMAL